MGKDLIDRALEFGRMGCLQKDTRLTGTQRSLQCLIAASSMRIQQIPRLRITTTDSLSDLLVRVAIATDQRTNLLITVKVDDAGKIRLLEFSG